MKEEQTETCSYGTDGLTFSKHRYTNTCCIAFEDLDSFGNFKSMANLELYATLVIVLVNTGGVGLVQRQGQGIKDSTNSKTLAKQIDFQPEVRIRTADLHEHGLDLTSFTDLGFHDMCDRG